MLRYAAVGAVVAGLLLRATFVARAPPDQFVFGGDALDYHSCAVNLLAGEGFSLQPSTRRLAHVPPLYPIVLAGTYAVFGAGPAVARWLNVVLSLACLLALYFLGRRRNESAGLVGAAVFALYPHAIYYTTMEGTETLAMFLAVLVAMVLDRSERTPTLLIAGLLLGLTMGLLALTRGAFLFLPIWILPYLAVCQLAVGRPLARILPSMAVACLVFLMVLAPWAIRNYSVFGGFIPMSLGQGRIFYVRYIGELSAGEQEEYRLRAEEPMQRYLQPAAPIDEFEGDRALMAIAEELGMRHPKVPVFAVAYNVFRFWSILPAPTYLRDGVVLSETPNLVLRGLSSALLVLPFLFALFVGPVRRQIRPFLVIIFYSVAVHAVIWGSPRYRKPIEPLLALIFGILVTTTWGFLRPRDASRQATA